MGFKRGKSTEHNLIHAVNYIGQAFNENKYCLGVFFDLKKAFDVCSHSILLMKLERMGVRGLPWTGLGATWITAPSLWISREPIPQKGKLKYQSSRAVSSDQSYSYAT